jgi:dTDP-4-dehydrorhamnose reductase
MVRVLLFGHTGKLGQALFRAFEPRHEVSGCSASTGCDAGDPVQVRARIAAVRPQLVVNAAALNGLEACEGRPELAMRLNALLPRLLAEDAAEVGYRLVHFSTDAVFDGARTAGCYLESDPAAPINVYGLTKYGGDCFVQAANADAWIFRLSMLAGAPGSREQFVERMLRRAKAGEPLRVADDITCSPSFADDVARAVAHHVEADGDPGLFHLANAGQVTLFELIRELVDLLGLGVTVTPVRHETFPSKARKNPCTPLASARLAAPLRDWRAAMRAYCATL